MLPNCPLSCPPRRALGRLPTMISADTEVSRQFHKAIELSLVGLGDCSTSSLSLDQEEEDHVDRSWG